MTCYRFCPAPPRSAPVLLLIPSRLSPSHSRHSNTAPLPCSAPVLPPIPSRLSPSRPCPDSDFSPAFSQSPNLASAPPISFSLPTVAPPLPHFPPQSCTAPGLSFAQAYPHPAPQSFSQPRPTAPPSPAPTNASANAPAKKRTAGIAPAVLSIYRRTAAPSLRAGITPRPSLPWQPSWRSSPRQPPWRSSARPDLRCRPASSSRPKR